MTRFVLPIFVVLMSGCVFSPKRTQPKDYFEKTYELAHEHLKEKKEESAESLFREVYQIGIEVSPEYSAAALFELAKINEKRGNFELALSQLRELDGKKAYLPKTKADLELPARIAGVYAALGEIRASESYAMLAERGLQVYAAQIRPDINPQWWAEIYHRMSTLPVDSLEVSNWSAFSKRFEMSLPYLIRSMEYADAVWSQRSLTTAEIFFKKTLELASFSQTPDDSNWNSALQNSREQLDRVEYLIQKSQLWKIEGPNTSRWSRSYFTYLAELEKVVSKMRRQLPEAAPLSAESAKRKEIKRTDLDLKPVEAKDQRAKP